MSDGLHIPLMLELPAVDRCWNSIGVRGDRSCPELTTRVHCRNCPVYAAAARTLLDVESPRDYVAEWTMHLSQPELVEEDGRLSVFVFRVGEEWLAVPTRTVTEVAEARQIRSLPHRRTGVVLGLANVRGELLVCVSISRVLGLDPVPPSPAAKNVLPRLLVLQFDSVRVACPADEVHGIVELNPSDVVGVPATVANAATSYSKGVTTWRGTSVGLLDDQRLHRVLKRSLA